MRPEPGRRKGRLRNQFLSDRVHGRPHLEFPAFYAFQRHLWRQDGSPHQQLPSAFIPKRQVSLHSTPPHTSPSTATGSVNTSPQACPNTTSAELPSPTSETVQTQSYFFLHPPPSSGARPQEEGLPNGRPTTNAFYAIP
jgi:hypothetical protein